MTDERLPQVPEDLRSLVDTTDTDPTFESTSLEGFMAMEDATVSEVDGKIAVARGGEEGMGHFFSALAVPTYKLQAGELGDGAGVREVLQSLLRSGMKARRTL